MRAPPSGGVRISGVCGTCIVGELSKQGALAASGDLSRLEEMMAVQAYTLDALFNEYAKLSRLNLNDHLDASERFMRLALKAQSQCRSTIESLAEVKNPSPVAFVKQANIASGHQQVNNGPPRAGNENQSNELLERPDARLDTRAALSTVIGNPALASLGAIDRAEEHSGQETVEPEQLQARGALTRSA